MGSDDPIEEPVELDRNGPVPTNRLEIGRFQLCTPFEHLLVG
jgi:hypothetical protein